MPNPRNDGSQAPSGGVQRCKAAYAFVKTSSQTQLEVRIGDERACVFTWLKAMRRLPRYCRRKGVAEWLGERLAEDVPTLVGIDHAFSFPLRYFEAHGLKPDWPTLKFLASDCRVKGSPVAVYSCRRATDAADAYYELCNKLIAVSGRFADPNSGRGVCPKCG